MKYNLKPRKDDGICRGHTPYGFFKDEHLKLHECPQEQAIIQLIIKYNSAGLSSRAIAEILKDQGIKARKNTLNPKAIWSYRAIARLIYRFRHQKSLESIYG
jgi:transposase-like protein